MTKKVGPFWLVVILMAYFGGSQAYAMVSFSLVGGVSDGLTKFTDPTGTTTQGKMGYGGGLLVGLNFVPFVGLETGAIYFANSMDSTNSGITVSPGMNSIYIPFDLRLHPLPMISVSVGGFYNHFTESGVQADYGWEAGARFSLHRLFIDGRYCQGLRDYGSGLNFSNLIGLVGIQL